MRRQEAVILTTQHLEKIADLTLEHYNRRAEVFWEVGQWLRRSISSIRCQLERHQVMGKVLWSVAHAGQIGLRPRYVQERGVIAGQFVSWE